MKFTDKLKEAINTIKDDDWDDYVLKGGDTIVFEHSTAIVDGWTGQTIRQIKKISEENIKRFGKFKKVIRA